MTKPTRLKKSESLEIRLPYPTKVAFMARCQADGRSASEALRGFIDQQVGETRPAPRLGVRGRIGIGAVIAAMVGAAALPSLAMNNRPTQAQARAEFQRLDANRDGVISFDEYRASRR